MENDDAERRNDPQKIQMQKIFAFGIESRKASDMYECVDALDVTAQPVAHSWSVTIDGRERSVETSQRGSLIARLCKFWCVPTIVKATWVRFGDDD